MGAATPFALRFCTQVYVIDLATAGDQLGVIKRKGAGRGQSWCGRRAPLTLGGGTDTGSCRGSDLLAHPSPPTCAPPPLTPLSPSSQPLASRWCATLAPGRLRGIACRPTPPCPSRERQPASQPALLCPHGTPNAPRLSLPLCTPPSPPATRSDTQLIGAAPRPAPPHVPRRARAPLAARARAAPSARWMTAGPPSAGWMCAVLRSRPSCCGEGGGGRGVCCGGAVWCAVRRAGGGLLHLLAAAAAATARRRRACPPPLLFTPPPPLPTRPPRRLQYASSIGCDGVDPDNVQVSDADSGFALTDADSAAYVAWLAGAAHSLGMGIGLKNGAALIPLKPPGSGGKTIGALVDWCVGGMPRLRLRHPLPPPPTPPPPPPHTHPSTHPQPHSPCVQVYQRGVLQL